MRFLAMVSVGLVAIFDQLQQSIPSCSEYIRRKLQKKFVHFGEFSVPRASSSWLQSVHSASSPLSQNTSHDKSPQ